VESVMPKLVFHPKSSAKKQVKGRVRPPAHQPATAAGRHRRAGGLQRQSSASGRAAVARLAAGPLLSAGPALAVTGPASLAR
jgi:hypothetical protein